MLELLSAGRVLKFFLSILMFLSHIICIRSYPWSIHEQRNVKFVICAKRKKILSINNNNQIIRLIK